MLFLKLCKIQGHLRLLVFSAEDKNGTHFSRIVQLKSCEKCTAVLFGWLKEYGTWQKMWQKIITNIGKALAVVLDNMLYCLSISHILERGGIITE